MKKWILFGALIGWAAVAAQAQLLKKITNAAKAKVENKAVQKAEETIDKAFEGKWVKDTTAPQTHGNTGVPTASTSFASYSKFDFIPGEKVLVFEDFSQDSTGDFPAKWNTNASGEVVKAAGHAGNWLRLNNTGVYMPEYIKNLPENFTLEFDLLCNPEFRYSASPLYFAIASLTAPKDYVVWQEGWGGRKGFLTWVLPTSPTGKSGKTGYRYYNDNGEDWGEKETSKFHGPVKNKVRVSVWRQKQRVRVYLDEEKIVDIAKGLNPGDYNALVFALNTQKTAPDQYLLSNIRLAVGASDTRNKLITEGKFVTAGILFDVASDKILPPSYGVLKEIATALQSDATVKIKITGHTDSDGDAAANKALSERRAAAVKKALETEFGIAAERMQSSGKGEAEPLGDNKTTAGKAQNRRVEFVKL
jgi:outer membrane protein OmpA-like peptidoglycan-associated protein